MKTKALALFSATILAITAVPASAAVGFIYHDSATTTGGEFSATNFPIENLKNAGHASHLATESTAEFNKSYATTNPPTEGYPVTITMDFNTAVNLTDFYLWNHSNNNTAGSVNAGVKDFKLRFYDGASGGGNQIGTEFVGVASAAPNTTNTNYAAQVFDFGTTYNNVRSVQMEITSRIGGGTSFVAIRELGFEAIPEPGSLALLGLGLGSFLLRRRR